MPASDRPIEFTDLAVRNMLACIDKVLTEPENVKQAESLLVSLRAVFGLGGKIYAEDDLSLYGVSFIHYGMIYHRSTGTWSVHS